MKSLNSDTARRARVRTVMGHPAVSVTIAISVAIALTLFGTTRVMAVVAVPSPTETAQPSPTSTVTPGPIPITVPAPAPSATPTPSPTPGVAPSPSLQTFAAPGDHHVLARIEGSAFQASYLPVDEPVPDAQPFQTFRVRFRLHNAGTVAITTTPRLEYRTEEVGSYLVVPEKPEPGVPFHVAREWVPSPAPGVGTVQSQLGEYISASDLLMGPDNGLAVNGHHSMGANPDQPITLPSDSYTEQEFTVALSMDAKYLTGYQLRITDGGTPLTGTDVAVIRLGTAPAVLLSPGQREGVVVADPPPGPVTAGVDYPLLSQPQSSTPVSVSSAPATLSSNTSVSAVSAVYQPSTGIYPLTASTLSAATYVANIHGPYTLTADQCAICHSGHTAQGPNLLKAGSQSALCFTCHDGTGATANVQAEYNPTVALPVNNPTTRDYYSHDADASGTHTRSDLDEFGALSNRHSSCADCHNSHKAKALPDSTQTPAGWDASGRLAGVSGVSVVNSPTAGLAPTYTFLSGATDPANEDDPVTNLSPITLEYQLCFKCHSGFTKLPSNVGFKPSQYMLDKAVEFNPANPSFHPVEAAGTNRTAKMQLSLDGTSPNKLWNFNTTSTIRCLNCHTSGTTPDAPTAPTDAALAGGSLPPHTSSNRGILLRNYRDQVLKPGADVKVGGVVVDKAAYNAGDFALCYVCHAEEPFANSRFPASANDTNFAYHGLHLNLLAGYGGSTLTGIDTPGAGQGNAVCAECHFRIHSTTNKVGTQQIDGSRLVNFAPDVVANAGTLSWTRGATSGGSCTLTCHGYTHTNLNY